MFRKPTRARADRFILDRTFVGEKHEVRSYAKDNRDRDHRRRRKRGIRRNNTRGGWSCGRTLRPRSRRRHCDRNRSRRHGDNHVNNNIPAGFAPIGCNYGIWNDGDVPTYDDSLPDAVVGGGPNGVVNAGESDTVSVVLPPGEYDFHWFCIAEGVADNENFDNFTPGPWLWGTPEWLAADNLAYPSFPSPHVNVTVTDPVVDPEPEPSCFGSVCLP